MIKYKIYRLTHEWNIGNIYEIQERDIFESDFRDDSRVVFITFIIVYFARTLIHNMFFSK